MRAVVDDRRSGQDAFRAALPEAMRGELDEAAEAALAQATARGREAWPAIRIEEEVWLGHLASRLREGAPLAAQLEAIDAGGLYLAAACLRGVPAAIEAFEREVLPSARRALAGRADAAVVDEILQRVRARLLTEIHGAPRLAIYGGRGPIGGFVRTVAVHLLSDDEAAARPTEDDDALAGLGQVHIAEGACAAGLAQTELAMAICAKSACEPVDAATIEFLHAQALVCAGRPRPQAVPHARRALALYRAQGSAAAEQIAEIEAWLR